MPEEVSQRHVPPDNQHGDALGGPPIWPAAAGSRPNQVAAWGIGPNSYLRHAVLCEVFGYLNVHIESGRDPAALPRDCAVVIGEQSAPPASWRAFCAALGTRTAVVDVRAAAAMARRDGWDLQTRTNPGSRAAPIEVFHRRMSTEVFPGAPRVEVVADVPESAGFGVGDGFHLYWWDERGEPALTTLVRDDAFDRFAAEQSLRVWAESVRHPALMVAATPAGGRIDIMDLRTVDRLPEPSGVETLATQVFLSALNVSRPVFGKFLRAYGPYEEYVQSVRELAARHSDIAALDAIGESVDGRTLWVLKVRPRPEAPVVLFSSCIHPLEWAPAYGMLRYVRFLLEGWESGRPLARAALAGRRLCWVLSACPDGWETRDQQASGINLNRNFPGAWEHCTPGETYWDAYNRRFVPSDPEPEVSRGPSPGSQPETQALMGLLEGARVRTLCDMHETTAPDSFLHQHQAPDGSIPDIAWHSELAEGTADAFNGRFRAHANVLAYRPGLNDFSTYRFRALRSLRRLTPNSLAGWIGYAVHRGLRALVVEAAGSDCTHYQTIRRTEYAAIVAEQVMMAEQGRLARNPHAERRVLRLDLPRRPERLICRVCDAAGATVEETEHEAPERLEKEAPAGGWVWAFFK